MSGVEIAFWLCAACVVYTYAGYPLLLGVCAKLRRRPVRRLGPVPRSVAFVVCAHNEVGRIAKRLEELTKLLDCSGAPESDGQG